MSILTIKDLSHDFGDKVLYKNVNFEIYKNEKVGITGANGAGKTTFMKLLTGIYTPDQGQIIWHSDIKIGHLDQYATIDQEQTIYKYLHSNFDNLYQTEKEMLALYQKNDFTTEDLIVAGKYQDILIEHDFYNLDTEIQKIVIGLGLEMIGLNKKISEISGGQRAKVILAKLLLEKPHILLLDEPTNFLDSHHISWLIDYLNDFSGAYIIISHDFNFLEAVTSCILDIDYATIKKYHGKYSEFIKQKEHLHKDYLRRYQSQQEQIKKTEQFIRKNIAGNNTRIAQGRRKQLTRLERLKAPTNITIPTFYFKELPLISKEILKVNNLTIGYDNPLLSKINFLLLSHEKIAITGFNGIGKSTLLKTLIQEISPISGDLKFNEQIKIAYYSQDFLWPDKNQNAFEIIHDYYPKFDSKTIRNNLAHFNLNSDLIKKPVYQLSGGEQAKIKLCILALTPCHLLILDEPTNHLDKDIKLALIGAIKQFSGSVIIVSHELDFYKDLVDRIIKIEKYNY